MQHKDCLVTVLNLAKKNFTAELGEFKGLTNLDPNQQKIIEHALLMCTSAHLFLFNPFALEDSQIIKALIDKQLLFMIIGLGPQLFQALSSSA